MKNNAVRSEMLPSGTSLDTLNKHLESTGFRAEYRLVLTSLNADESAPATPAEPLPDAMAQQKIRAAVKSVIDLSDADLRTIAASQELLARNQDAAALNKKLMDQVSGRIQ